MVENETYEKARVSLIHYFVLIILYELKVQSLG